MQAIPVLDLESYRSGDAGLRTQFAAELRDGLCGLGFVALTGHGIEADLVSSVYRHFARFFAQGESEKLVCAGVPGGQRGFTPFGVEHAKGQARADLKEFFHVGQPRPEEAFGGPALLPGILAEVSSYERNVWPTDAEPLRTDCLRMFRALEACATTLLEALAAGFDLPPDAFAEMLRGGNSILRALHYPPVGQGAPEGALRAAPHEDINLITLLCEASDSGLEILPPGAAAEDAWVPVAVPPGQIVVDSGDMLTRVTNGVIPATTHRVVNPHGAGDGHRYSLPFFAHPRPSCDLSVMEAFVAHDRPPAWPPTTAEAFLRERLEEIGLLAGSDLNRSAQAQRDVPSTGA